MIDNPYVAPAIPAMPLTKERIRVKRLVAILVTAMAALSLIWLAVFLVQSAMPERRYVDLSNPNAPKPALTPAEKLQEILP